MGFGVPMTPITLVAPVARSIETRGGVPAALHLVAADQFQRRKGLVGRGDVEAGQLGRVRSERADRVQTPLFGGA